MMRSRQFAGVALGLALAAGPVASGSAQAPASENRLNAAVVSKLAQFIEWPAGAVERSSLDVCVADPDPFGSDLRDLVAGESLAGKPLKVRRVEREQELEGCRLLFLPARGSERNLRLLQKAVTLPIATVGDDAAFLDQGGVVQLRMVEGRVRFEISVTASDKVGLRLSSQLLQLALNVRGGD